jgi:peptidoglycan/LPS O-acetylase OafA/YrhL
VISSKQAKHWLWSIWKMTRNKVTSDMAATNLTIPKHNNLDLLRLVFAFQVCFSHVIAHIGGIAPRILDHIPGVPAFFFVSGFLIYASYQSTTPAEYFRNRFLRLFPGLLIACVAGVGLVFFAHGPVKFQREAMVVATWFLAQVTLGQAFNPASFRDIGVGVINGSLWTLTTEILFYFSIPLIVRLESRFKHIVLFLTALSYTIYSFGPSLLGFEVYHGKSIFEVLALTPIVWGWMFGIGIFAFKHFALLNRHMGLLACSAVALISMTYLDSSGIMGSTGNQLGLVYFLSYVGVIFCLAFGVPVKKPPIDISYGIYIWHMLAINFLLVIGLRSAGLAIVLTLLAALLSCILVERPMLRLKHFSTKPLAVGYDFKS